MVTLADTIERLRADFAVNAGTLPRFTMVVWRVGQAGHGRRDASGFVLRRLHDVLNHVWTRGFVGAELPRSVDVGAGLRIPHEARGVIISPFSSIGSGVTIYHQVTLGMRGAPTATPVLADNCYIGAGAKLIGPLRIGVGSSVGANAVVTRSVPDGEVWGGVPARPLSRRVIPTQATGSVTPGAATSGGSSTVDSWADSSADAPEGPA